MKVIKSCNIGDYGASLHVEFDPNNFAEHSMACSILDAFTAHTVLNFFKRTNKNADAETGDE